MRTKNPMAKKPQQILFSRNSYGPKVKVENWDYQNHIEKRDNYVYRDHLSQHLSTYLRWGDQDQNIGDTETRAMLKEIFTKTDPTYEFKPLVNFTSYPCTDTPGRNKLMKNANLAQLPPDFGVMDYLTTQQDDYRNPFSTITKPVFLIASNYILPEQGRHGELENKVKTLRRILVALCVEWRILTDKLTMSSPPWLLNQVIRSDLTHNHGTAPPKGDYQCLDTHTPIGHIRRMRLFRYQSFNPATCLQDFPAVDLHDNK